MAGREDFKSYHSMSDVVFNHSKKFAKGIAFAKPDYCDGARPDDINFHVRHELGRFLIPSKNKHYIAAPNFFVEGISTGGRNDVAKRQACHDGAIGARAMHILQNYKVDDPVYDGKARSFACILQKGTGLFQLYVTHLTPPKATNGHPEYHMTLVLANVMITNLTGFREAIVAFRNARELARTYRDELIQAANERALHLFPTGRSSTLHRSTGSSKQGRDAKVSQEQTGTHDPDPIRPTKKPRRTAEPRSEQESVTAETRVRTLRPRTINM